MFLVLVDKLVERVPAALAATGKILDLWDASANLLDELHTFAIVILELPSIPFPL